jgi:hypothetical protein
MLPLSSDVRRPTTCKLNSLHPQKNSLHQNSPNLNIMNNRILLTLAILIVLVGCASEPQKPLIVQSPYQQMSAPPTEQAQIVFVDPNSPIRGTLPVGIYEVKDGVSTLVAMTGAGSKALILLSPGHHLLMANQGVGTAHFLDANVEAGKRYYVLVRFIYGNGFQLRPIRATGVFSVARRDFSLWMTETHFVDSTSDGRAYFETYKKYIDEAQTVGWRSWLAKTDKERAEVTLNPQDAIDK